MMSPDQIEALRAMLANHERTLAELVNEQRQIRVFVDEIRTDREVRKERDRNLADHLERIETNVASIFSIGKWLLLTTGSGVLMAFITFMINGGLRVTGN